ncbi:MAG: ATP-binding cassette domain-containing protein, partial [Bacteroidota bacterium]
MTELTIQDLSKTYAGGKQGLTQFTHQFKPGITGLLGSNGAGKSTLMSLISTLATPTSGNIHFKGVDICKKPEIMQRALGFLPQTFGVFPNLSGQEFLNYIGLVKGLSPQYLKEAIPYYLNVFNLLPVAEKRIDSYSGGMRQR